MLPISLFLGGGGSGGWAGGGRLTISQGELRWDPDRVLRRLTGESVLVHGGSRVTVVRARLLPPLLNTAVILVGQNGYARILTWYGKHQTVVSALREAGFEVDEQLRWFTLGMRDAKRQANALSE